MSWRRWLARMATEVKVRYALPDMSLIDVVAIYLEITIAGDEASQDMIPPEMSSIRMAISGDWWHGATQETLRPNLSPNLLFGTSSKAQWAKGQSGTAFCIGLQPLAWPRLLGKKAIDFVDRDVPLASIWGAQADILFDVLQNCSDFEARVAATDQVLIADEGLSVHPSIAEQIMAIRTAIADPDCGSVDDLARRVGVNQAKLARLTRACFGFAPKLLIRRERFRRMLHRADASSYGEWRAFIEGQYVDQSHLIRDFKHFMGLAPSHYMALKRPFVAAAFATFRQLMSASDEEQRRE
jgi:AraC-like DNA-binding protein